MKRLRKITLLVCILFLAPYSAFAWEGKVIGISDGDTITVLHDNKPEKIRLYGIDCPEKHQAFGQKAKQFSSDKVFGKTVDINTVDIDRYGRTVGLVCYDNRKSLNESLVESGLAWVYKKYCHKPKCKSWVDSEETARINKAGLWSMPDPIPPWQFRRLKKTNPYIEKGAMRYKNVIYDATRRGKINPTRQAGF